MDRIKKLVAAATSRHLVVGLLAGLVLLFALSVGLQLAIYLRLGSLQAGSDAEEDRQPIPVVVVRGRVRVDGTVDVDVRNDPLNVKLWSHWITEGDPIPVRAVR